MSEQNDLEMNTTEYIEDKDENSDIESEYSNEPEETEFIDENEEIITDDLEDEDNKKETNEIIPKNERISRPFMTKYELVRIIGTRRKQLSLGAKPMIKIEGELSINEIVDEEIKKNMIPFKIKRPLPDSNKFELWDFDELQKSHLIK